jgi:hypothetical protein
MTQRPNPLVILLPTAIVALAACSRQAAVQPPSSQPPQQQYRLTATIQELMDGIIDPSADVLWESVAYVASTTGIEDRQPRTDQEWRAVRNSAITLIEAANLLAMPGRKVAMPHGSAAPATESGEPLSADIQQRVDANRGAFAQFARNLQDAGLTALAAIDAMNAARLMDAGGKIDEACEACHVTYWYPNQGLPK